MNKLLALLALIGAFCLLPVSTASAHSGGHSHGGHGRCGVARGHCGVGFHGRACFRGGPVVRAGWIRPGLRCAYGPRYYYGPRVVVCRRPGVVIRI